MYMSNNVSKVYFACITDQRFLYFLSTPLLVFFVHIKIVPTTYKAISGSNRSIVNIVGFTMDVSTFPCKLPCHYYHNHVHLHRHLHLFNTSFFCILFHKRVHYSVIVKMRLSQQQLSPTTIHHHHHHEMKGATNSFFLPRIVEL